MEYHERHRSLYQTQFVQPSKSRYPQVKSYRPFSIRHNSFTAHLLQPFYAQSSSSRIAMLLYVLLLTFLASPVLAFNVDLKTAVIHEGQNGSMFGYAVAQHIDQSTNWLLIGAPEAQTSQGGVSKGGAVFRCKTDRVNSCQEVPFDNTGNNIKYNRKLRTYLHTEEKSNQWFGATIETSGENGVIVACAPRYIYFGNDLKKREPVGMCWVAKTSTTKYEKYSPCAKGKSGFKHQGYCQAGFSAALSDDGRRLMIAAPGSWYWQGQLYNFKTEEGGKVYASTLEGNATEDDTYMGQLFEYDAVTGKPRYTNKEGDIDTDASYRGYSSAIGRFDGDDEDDYVVGVPKGDNYVGMIEMYTQDMTLIGAISGEQIGSYFGGTIAVTDLNGDRLDDIIVGAPLYTNFKHSKTWDTGRVYIYYQQSSPNMFKSTKRDILDGVSSQSRFGMALSGLGDINYDGYDDLCVGAPFAGEDKTGAIYIYHGSKKGIITEASQVIYASDFKVPLSTFGASISSGIDQDGNSYPDLLVGAYNSERAVFLRTRPVVRVYASLKLAPEKVNLETKSCTLVNRKRVTCLRMFTCFKYDGVGLPDELYFDLEWTLDAKEGNNSNAEQRAFYMTSQKSSTEKKTVKIKKDEHHCTSSYAYLKGDPADKLSPIKTNLAFELNLKKEDAKSRRKRELQPILDTYIPTHTTFTVQILKNCGKDEICIPDLFVTFIRVDIEHIVGSNDELEVLIIVGNNGEDSFNTKLYIELPPGVDYSGKSGERSDVPITCDYLEEGSRFVVCSLGNPMTKGSKSEFTFRVKPTNSNETQDSLEFTLHVNSSNPEDTDTYENNQVNFVIPVTADTKINLYGISSPEQLNATDQLTEGKGRLVRHVFSLQSHGVSPINETELQIRWPSRDNLGEPLLTLDGPLKIVGNGKCEIIIITPKNASKNVHNSNRDSRIDYRQEKPNRKTQNVECSYQYCTVIQCLIGYMTPYSSFSLTVHSRLKVGRFIEARRREAHGEEDIDMYHLISVARARVRSIPYDFKNIDKSKFPVRKLELVTKVSTDRFAPKSKGVAAWVYAVAITVGIFMLLILILILWCCGFFKRKKHDTEEGYFSVNGKNDIDNKIVD